MIEEPAKESKMLVKIVIDERNDIGFWKYNHNNNIQQYAYSTELERYWVSN